MDQGASRALPRAAPVHPIRITPFIRQVPHPRGGVRRLLPVEGVRIALGDLVAGDARTDVVLVERPGGDAADEAFPYSRLIGARRERVGADPPVVEVTDHGHPLRIRRPDRESRAIARHVGAQLFVGAKEVTRPEQVDVVGRELQRHRLRLEFAPAGTIIAEIETAHQQCPWQGGRGDRTLIE